MIQLVSNKRVYKEHNLTLYAQAMSSSPVTASVSSSSATLVEMYGCIVEYACCHRLLDVIQEVARCHGKGLSSLAVPHARLASAALYKIVITDNVTEYPTALLLAKQLFLTLGSFDNYAFTRCYAKLLCGLKVKILFHYLQSAPHRALALLREYFPRGGSSFDKELALKVPSLAKELRAAIHGVHGFRKAFLPLVAHECKRESFLRNQYEKLYGSYFSYCLARCTASFLTGLEKDLPDTFIDELLKTESEGVLTNSPVLSSDVMMEMLLDCVQGKTTLQSSDLLGLIKDLGPEVSPDLEGFQHSIMCISSSGELTSSGHSDRRSQNTGALVDANTQFTCDADADSESSSPGNCDDAGSRPRRAEVMEVSPSSEGSRSGDDDSPDFHKSAHCLGAQSVKRLWRTCNEPRKQKFAQPFKRKPRSLRRGKQDSCTLPACHVKLSYQKTLQTWCSSEIKYRLFT